MEQCIEWTSQLLPDPAEGSLGRGIQIGHTSYGAHRLEASETIKFGDVIAQAPLTRCLSAYSAFSSPIGSVLMDFENAHWQVGVEANEMVMVVHLMHEMLLGPKSAIYPMVAVMPEKPTGAVYFQDRELRELQDSSIVEDITRSNNLLGHKYKDFKQKVNSRYPGVFGPEYTFELFKKCYVLFWSRYFNTFAEIRLPGDESPSSLLSSPAEEKATVAAMPPRPVAGLNIEVTMVLIPVLSMINHGDLWPLCNSKEDESSFHFDEENNVYQLINFLEVPKGKEVQWCYNDFSNKDLMSDYGFSVPLSENGWEKAVIYTVRSTDGGDDIHLSWGARPETTSFTKRDQFTVRNSWFKRDRAKEVTGLQETVRHSMHCAVQANKRKKQRPWCTEAHLPPTIALFEQMISNFETSVEEDLALLGDQEALDAIGPYGKMVVQYRQAQKDLIMLVLARLKQPNLKLFDSAPK